MASTSPVSGRLMLAPGVRVVRVVGPQGGAHEIVDDARGVRVPVTAREAGILNLLRGGLAVDEVTRRAGSEGVIPFCQRLVTANLVVPVISRPTYLPDDRPKLIDGVKFYRTETPGVVSCHDPRTGRSYTMRDVDAMVARACDGQRTVLEICDAAQRRGVPATVQSMVSLLRELHARGCLEEPQDSQPNENREPDVEIPIVEGAPLSQVDDDPPPEKTIIVQTPIAPGTGLDALNAFDSRQKTQPSGEVVPVSALSQRLDALQSLSLDKGAEPRSTVGHNASSRLPWVLVFAMAFGFGAYQWWERRTETQAAAAPAAPLRTQIVMQETAANRSLVAAGYIAPRTPITVGVTISGRVKTILVNEGDRIKRNQILAQLDDGDAAAHMRLALAKAHDAQRSLARTKAMFAAQAATATDLEKAEGQLEIALAEVGVNRNAVAQMKVLSPIDGTVLEKLARPGEILTAMQGSTVGVVKVADLSDLVAEVDVNESDVPLVRPDQQTDVTTDVYPDRRYRGIVHQIAPQADRAKGTVKVKVDLHVKDGSLKPGMSVRASFDTSAGAKPRILLPRQAIVDGAVWVVTSRGMAERRTVNAQPVGPDLVEIVSGLSPGERVVVEAAASVSPGQRVE
jgi:RND family efflux transporter MFP subunit